MESVSSILPGSAPLIDSSRKGSEREWPKHKEHKKAKKSKSTKTTLGDEGLGAETVVKMLDRTNYGTRSAGTKHAAEDIETAESLVEKRMDDAKHAEKDNVNEEDARKEKKRVKRRLQKENKTRERISGEIQVKGFQERDVKTAKKRKHKKEDNGGLNEDGGVEKLKEKKKDKKRKRAEEENDPTRTDDDELERSHKKKKSKEPKQDNEGLQGPAESAQLKKAPKDKKPRNQMQEEEHIEPVTETSDTSGPRKKKKSKKWKHDQEDSDTNADHGQPAESNNDKKPRQQKRKEGETEGAMGEFQPDEQHQEKKAKKRKHKEGTSAPAEDTKSTQLHQNPKLKEADSAPTTTNKISASQWNASALPGDAARREKFLRLLGAGKSNRPMPDSESKNDAMEISHVEDELQRQFEAGTKMKYDGLGKRRGLGA